MATKRYGRYEAIRLIATGGMASVYLGRATGAGGFERLVAIKVMHAHIAHERDFVDMFLDEARLAAKIRHPNVVPTLDVAPDGRFIVMEYIEGASLHAIAKMLRQEEGDLLPLPCALRILVDGLNGLHAAHELQRKDGSPLHIVHRDISPQNILVGVDGISRITDFGVARAESRITSTRGSQLKGKLPYMAQEQLRNEPLDRRADVYAAGVVLWEVLAGRPLFHGDSDAAVAFAIMAGPQHSPRQLNGAIPAAIDAVCMQALEPADVRFQTAEAFAEALEEAAAAAGIALARPRAVGALARQAAERVEPPPEFESDPAAAAVEPAPWAPDSSSSLDRPGSAPGRGEPPPLARADAAPAPSAPSSSGSGGATPAAPGSAPAPRSAGGASPQELLSLRSTLRIEPEVPDDDATVPLQRPAGMRQAIAAELERRRATGSSPGSAGGAAPPAAASAPGPAAGTPPPGAGPVAAVAVPWPSAPAGSTPISGVAPPPAGPVASGQWTPISGVAPLDGRDSSVPTSGMRQVQPADQEAPAAAGSGMSPRPAGEPEAVADRRRGALPLGGPSPRRPVAIVLLGVVGLLLVLVGGGSALLLGPSLWSTSDVDETTPDGAATAGEDPSDGAAGDAEPSGAEAQPSRSASSGEEPAEAAGEPSAARRAAPSAGTVPRRPPARPVPSPQSTEFHPAAP